jgi:Ca2+-binding RTX toxin-like protein
MPINYVYGSNGHDIIVFGVTDGVDYVFGYDGMDSIHGKGGDDVLFGGNHNDVLHGEGDNDTLKGGGGADDLFGGPGTDTAVYDDSDAGVIVSLLSGSGSGGDAAGDELDSIENLRGSFYADTLLGDNDDNELHGLNGNDSLKGYGGADTLWGGIGNDFLYGMNNDDTLHGGDGHDHLNGGAGGDVMIGGTGNDTYVVDHFADVVTESGSQGIDIVRTVGSWTMTPGADIETLETTDATATTSLALYGNATGNQIIGNDGDNFLDGGGGVDQMVGNGGDDTYYVDNAGDSVVEVGGDGVDEVRTHVSWTLTAGSDVEILRPTTYADMSAMNLTGNGSANSVWGNHGNNIINGAGGNDELTGLVGQDSFLFNTALNAATNLDVITDFSVADDTIQLDDDVFSSSLGLGNISAGELVIGAAALDANDRIIYNDATGALFYDSDGVGGTAQIQFATLSTGLALTNLDFLVVA